MKLENQVCSLEFAKRLNELGVKQESEFYWRRFDINGELQWLLDRSGDIPMKMGIAIVGFGACSAFTVAELGEMLPEDYDVTKKIGDEWGAYELDCGELGLIYVPWPWPKTEADARALMLCYLIEQVGIMKP